MLDAGFLERNLLTSDVEIDYSCMTELSYEYFGNTNYVELYVNDFYIGLLEVFADDCERYNVCYIIINNEVIFLEDITNRKPNLADPYQQKTYWHVLRIDGVLSVVETDTVYCNKVKHSIACFTKKEYADAILKN